MPQSEKMRSVDVEGVGSFDVPASWDESQVQSYLKAYRAKNPGVFKGKQKQESGGGLQPLPERGKKTSLSSLYSLDELPQRPSLTERASKLGSNVIPSESGPERNPVDISTYGMSEYARTQTPAARQMTETLQKPILPEGIVQTSIGTLARTAAGDINALPHAKLAYELHKAGLHKDQKPEQWIRNGVINSLWDLGEITDDTVRGLTTPENLALLVGMAALPETGGPALIARLTSGGFSLQQAKEAADHITKSYQFHLAGDDVAAGKELANSTVSSAFAILSAFGARHEGGIKGRLREEWKEHFKKEGHSENDAARMAEFQVGRSSDPPPEAPARHTTAEEVRRAEEQQHREQGGVGLPGHPEVRTGAARTPQSATPSLRSQEIPPVRAVPPGEEKQNVPRETIDQAAVNVGVTPEGIQEGGKEPFYQFTDGQVGGTFYVRESEIKGKSPEEVEQILGEKARAHREKNAPTGTEDEAVRDKRERAQSHFEEFRGRHEEARAQAAPANQQPTPMPTMQQPRPVTKQTLRTQLSGAWNQVANLLSPASRGPHARATALSLREAAAKIAADDEHADHLLKEFRAQFDRELRSNPQAGLDWIDTYETGAVMPDPKHAELARRWKQLQTTTWREVQRREGMQRFIDQYFPHLFKDPAQAAQVFSRRPLEGPRSWRFKRQFPTLKDAMVFARSQGITLEPMYENPVDYMTAKLHEMNKYIHMHDFQEEMKAANIWKFSPDIKPPLGMARIDDPLGTVWGSPTEKLTLREGFDKLLFDQLNGFARSLGIDHIRKVKLRGGEGVWGYTIRGQSRVWTKHAGPESVLTHELGHQLHFRYPELDALIKDPASKDELRQLADMRYEGTNPQMVSGYYKRYVRAGTEKIANLIHAYVHMRERGRRVAPNTFARLDHIIERHPELQPLREISPSLVLGTNTEVQDLYVGRRIFGYYYAPEAAARITNNYLKPGLAGKPLFEIARRPANLLNQVQLGGISFFHFTFTAVDTATSMFSLGLQRISRGQVFSGLGALARSNIVTAPIETYIRGNKALKEFYGSPQGQFYADTVNRLIQGGGRVKMDSFYHNSSVESFLRAWRRGNVKDAALSAVPAAVEAQAIPIMQHWVPRMKLGTFSLLAEEELARVGPNANLWEQRGALARAWDSTDNRLGQLVYDNLFWNRTLKDIGLISVRSLGWNLGTFREIGGGMFDLGRFTATRGKSGMTPRMAYTLALPAVIALHGAMFMYLMTGKGPQEPIDYFYPHTGRTNPDGSPERIGIPSYMRDEWAYGSGFRLGPERGLRQVATTLGHKLNPELSMTMEMLRNRDFYGTKIRNEDDPLVKQLEDTMKYVGEQFEPFWLRNLQQRKQQEGEITPRNFIESMFGIQPAPRSVTRSTAEALAADYLSERMPAGARTPEKAKAARTRGELIRQFRAKDPKMWQNLSKAMKDGEISADDRRDIFRAMRMSPLQMMVQRLGLDQALNVYDAAKGEEKEQVKRALRGKFHLIRNLPQEQQERTRERWIKIFGKPQTDRPEPETVPVSDEE